MGTGALWLECFSIDWSLTDIAIMLALVVLHGLFESVTTAPCLKTPILMALLESRSVIKGIYF